jgi:uncharacterized damage-inducible protein DinB
MGRSRRLRQSRLARAAPVRLASGADTVILSGVHCHITLPGAAIMTVPAASSSVTAAGVALLAALTLAVPAAAQHDHHRAGDHSMPTHGLRAELIQGLDGVAEKYLALADATVDHYAWRPGEGVRSMGELLAHVAAGNFMIATMGGVDLPDGMTMDQVREMGQLTDPALIREALAHSFRHIQHGIARTPAESLDDAATLFGRETTRRGVFLLLATHAHEHLGQAIAYARTNGVVPPWSAAR